MRWPIIAVTFAFAISRAPAQDMPLSQVLIEGGAWKVAAGPYEEIYILERTPFRADVILIWPSTTETCDEIRSDGKLYLADRPALKLSSYRPKHQWAVVTNDFFGSVITANAERKIIEISAPIGKWGRSVRISGFGRPSGIALSHDGSTLFSGDEDGKYVWAFRVEKESDDIGAAVVSAGQPYGLLRAKPNEPSAVRRLEIDTDGRIYALTNLGVQILDPTGRLCGILTSPTREPLVGFAFGGPDGRQLYVASKTTVYVRKIKTQGLGFGELK